MRCKFPTVMKMLLSIVLLFGFGNVGSVLIDSGVYVIDSKGEVLRHLSARSALFGPDIPDKGISGHIVYASPPDACTQIASAPQLPNNQSNWIVLIRRSECSFVQKIRNAQAAGYVAAIVHSVDSDMLVPMSGEVSGTVTIPSVYVGITCANTLLKYNSSMSHRVLLEMLDFNYIKFLWPFVLVLSVCMSILLLFTVVKCVVNQIKKCFARMPPSALRKLPIKKFRKGDRYDTCAICLEEYESGDKLRLLPCSHTFHKKCIDPWLTKNKRTCPLCKKKAIERPPGDNQSESDDSADEVLGGSGQSSERTPLLLSGRVTTTTQSPRSTYGVVVTVDATDATRSSGVEVHRSSSQGSVNGEIGIVDQTEEEANRSAEHEMVEIRRESGAVTRVSAQPRESDHDDDVVVVIQASSPVSRRADDDGDVAGRLRREVSFDRSGGAPV